MDVKTYCANMKEEVETWKSTVNHHMLKADRRSSDVDEALENIHKINDLVGQMEKNVADLEDQCPADWSSEKAQIDDILSEVNRLWQEAADGSPDDL